MVKFINNTTGGVMSQISTNRIAIPNGSVTLDAILDEVIPWIVEQVRIGGI